MQNSDDHHQSCGSDPQLSRHARQRLRSGRDDFLVQISLIEKEKLKGLQSFLGLVLISFLALTIATDRILTTH